MPRPNAQQTKSTGYVAMPNMVISHTRQRRRTVVHWLRSDRHGLISGSTSAARVSLLPPEHPQAAPAPASAVGAGGSLAGCARHTNARRRSATQATPPACFRSAHQLPRGHQIAARSIHAFLAESSGLGPSLSKPLCKCAMNSLAPAIGRRESVGSPAPAARAKMPVMCMAFRVTVPALLGLGVGFVIGRGTSRR